MCKTKAMGINLTSVVDSSDLNTSQTISVTCDYDPLRFSLGVGQEVHSKGEVGLGGSQVGDLGYTPISPIMLGETPS